MTFEQTVQDALRGADQYEPSPDLFAKVRRSIEDDAAHRSRVKAAILWLAAGVLAVMAYLAVTVRLVNGTASMSFRALESLTTAIMVAIVLIVGPAIRRFGKTYESDVFRASPETGAQVLRLLDVAYYLIFGAFVLMTLLFDPGLGFGGTIADWLRGELVRLGGLLLLMGVLHVALLIALPIVGLVYSANQRRIRIAQDFSSTDPGLDGLDKVITVVAWIAAGLVVVQLLFAVLNLILVGL